MVQHKDCSECEKSIARDARRVWRARSSILVDDTDATPLPPALPAQPVQALMVGVEEPSRSAGSELAIPVPQVHAAPESTFPLSADVLATCIRDAKSLGNLKDAMYQRSHQYCQAKNI